MRNILCERCATEKNKLDGTRVLFPRSKDGQPAEIERIVWGRALDPKPENRVQRITTGGVTTNHPLPQHQYDCDLCSAVIRPGERCCAQTVWMEDRPIPPWESEYIKPEAKS